ncbi:hypothetical protein [Roseateles sp. BYS87W]|uniref:HXXEE domain-containing protein n=1 Tax=Pelomonas baiyunensis TaxID=3299026 RepID=A0ABW7GTL4_9BURK
MSASLALRLRWFAFALGAEALHLAWEAMHGGIVTHHLMQRSDWPGLSNAWGLLVVPALAAWAAGRWDGAAAQRRQVAWGGVVALAWGLALSTAFAWPWPAATEVLFFGLLLAALAWPVHRAECLLGWVLGMSWTFGALLPTAIGAVLMLLSWSARGAAGRAYRWARPH